MAIINNREYTGKFQLYMLDLTQIEIRAVWKFIIRE